MHFDSATTYIALDKHRRNDFKGCFYVSTDFGRTFRPSASNVPTDRPNSSYVIREDPVNRTCCTWAPSSAYVQ